MRFVLATCFVFALAPGRVTAVVPNMVSGPEAASGWSERLCELRQTAPRQTAPPLIAASPAEAGVSVPAALTAASIDIRDELKTILQICSSPSPTE